MLRFLSLIMYQYEKDEKAFIVKAFAPEKVNTSTKGWEEVGRFQVPEKISLWQVMEFARYGGELVDGCKDMGKVIATGVLAALSNKDKTKQGELLLSILDKLEQLTKGSFADGIAAGFADIFSHIGKDKNLAKYAATLFLADGETMIEKALFEERVNLFVGMPLSFVWEGLMSFFGDKIELLKNFRLRFTILETPEKKESTSSSDLLTPVSESSIASSNPSQTDIPNETATS